MNPPESEWDHIILIGTTALGLVWGLNQAHDNAAQIGQWLREHHLLVSAQEATVILADTGAGLDIPRIMVLAGTLLLLIIGLTYRRRRRTPGQR